MCGRYLRRSDKQRIAEHFRLGHVAPVPLPADFNIAPTTHQPVIRLNRDTGERELVLMRWGLVPYHAKSLADYRGISTINARAESITSGLWKRLFERHRCLVPADGFYEWQTLPSALSGPRAKKPKVAKKPFVFSLNDDLPFAFAGLWDAWLDPTTSQWLQSFSIVTTESNELLSSIHTRMPVILEPRHYARWLDRTPGTPLPLDLLRPYDSSSMRSHPANPKVNNARNNGEEMLHPPSEEPQDGDLPLNPA
jgi:putative SOS response-associated peptidase YedK